MMNSRFVQLDALRGIAVLMVVLFHFTTRFGELYGHPSDVPFSFYFGQYGVDLFFIVSGYVIFMTVKSGIGWQDFLVSRFARLFPAYWVAVLVSACAVTVFALPDRQVLPLDVLINLSMLQEWFAVPHVDGVYWTLSLELSFYLLVLVMLCLNLLPRVSWLALLWLGGMVSVRLAQNYLGLTVPPGIKTTFLLLYGHWFVAGMMFYAIHNRKADPLVAVNLLGVMAVEFLLAGPIAAFRCSLFLLLFFAATKRVAVLDSLLSARPLVYLGTISYSVYLLHQNIGYIVMRAAYDDGLSPAIAISLACLISLVLAICLNALVENPARAYLRKLWLRRSAVA
jgi:peptidoglycan/LPS O-acetylase OafA/YrhL